MVPVSRLSPRKKDIQASAVGELLLLEQEKMGMYELLGSGIESNTITNFRKPYEESLVHKADETLVLNNCPAVMSKV